MNEASMYTLFSKSKGLSFMKKLMEGDGHPLDNKYKNPITGFMKAYTLITCNSLPCPFVKPRASTSGFTYEEYECEKEAMAARSVLVEFTQKFHESGIGEFDEKEWA